MRVGVGRAIRDDHGGRSRREDPFRDDQRRSFERRGQREGSIPSTTHAEEAALLLVSSAQMIAQLKFTRRAPAKVRRFVVDMVRGVIGTDPVDAAPSSA